MAINGDHDFFRHAGFIFDPLQQRAKLGKFRAAPANARCIDMAGFIGRKIGNRRIRSALWLLPVKPNNARVKAYRWQHTVQRGRRDAFGQRLLPHLAKVGPKSSLMRIIGAFGGWRGNILGGACGPKQARTGAD